MVRLQGNESKFLTMGLITMTYCVRRVLIVESAFTCMASRGLTGGFAGSEIVFGGLFNSVALLSDGFHNLADSGAFFIALFAAIADRSGVGGKDARMCALGGLINCSITLVLTFICGIEALRRLWLTPSARVKPDIQPVYYVIACLGICMNGFGALFLGGHGHSHGGLPCPSHPEPHPKKSSKVCAF